MNAKLIVALIAFAAVAVSAKPATRLENAVNEVVKESALAFRDAATSAIKNAEGSAVSEVEHLAGAATGMVTGATSPTASVGFFGSICNFFSGMMNSVLGIFGMGKPSVGASLPGVGGAGGMLSHVPGVGAAVGEAEKVAAGMTGGKLRRRRSLTSSAAQASGGAILGGIAHTLEGGTLAGSAMSQASNMLSAVQGKKCVLGWVEYIYTLCGWFDNSCTMANSVGGTMAAIPGVSLVAGIL